MATPTLNDYRGSLGHYVEDQTMTVKITVKHEEAEGPAIVVLRAAQQPHQVAETLGKLQPGESREFFIWRGASVLVKEE